MANLTRKTFTSNGTFVAPAGVTRVKTMLMSQNVGGFLPLDNAGNDISTLFIDAQNNAYTFGGENSYGQLGTNINTTISYSSPILVVGGNRYQKIWATQLGGTSGSACWALDTIGNLWAWGSNINGALGDGTTANRSSPIVVKNVGAAKFKSLITYLNGNTVSVLALDGLKRAWAWGSNTNSTAGSGSNQATTVAYSSPTAVTGSHSFASLFVTQPASSVTGSVSTVFGIDTTGAMWAWGSNNSGITGTGTNPGSVIQLSSPTVVVGSISWATLFSVPQWTTSIVFGLDTSGNLWSWGNNANGQCGNNSATTAFSSPVQVVGSHLWSTMATHLATFPTTQLTMNAQGALDTSGNAWCWGSNVSGQCGNNSATAAFSSPVQVVGGLTFTKLFTFSDSSFAANCFWGLDSSGNMWGWGENRGGLLGIGTRLSVSSPVQIVFPVGATAITKVMGFAVQNAVNVSPGTMIAVLDDTGHMYTWGSNVNGLAGTGVASVVLTNVTSSPVQVVGGYLFSNFFADNSLGGSSAGGAVYAVDFAGNIYAWGTNQWGQLGVGDVTFRSSPTLVVGTGTILNARTQQTRELTVVPGTSYAIILQGSYGFFGITCVGFGMDSMTVEYEQ